MNRQLIIRVLTRSYAPAWAVLLVGASLTLVSSTRLRQQSREADQVRFARAVQQTVAAIQERLRQYETAASSTADFFAARGAVSQPEWRFRVQMLANEQNYPGLLEAGYAELLPAVSNSPPATAPTAGSRPGMFKVMHGWAREPSAMSGVDPEFLDQPDQAEAAWRSVQNSSPTLSGLRELSAEVNGGLARGVTIFAPIFFASSEQTVPGEKENQPRHARPRGVSFCAIEPGLLLDSLFGEAPREIGFELFSQPNPAAQHWLNPSAKTPRALNPDFRAYVRTNFPLQVLNRTWVMHCYTTPLFERESSLARPRLVLPLGLGLSLALTGLLVIQIHARIRQLAIVAELQAACEELQQVQSERERVSRDLHDGSIQSLYVLQLALGRCERFFPMNRTIAGEILGQVKSGIDDLIAELRRFLLRDDNQPAGPISFPMAYATLQQLVQRWGKIESIKIQMTGNASAPVALTAAQLGHLKQIAQEAISNSLRHSRAKAMTLDFSAAGSVVRLTITDNGQGFEPQKRAGAGNGLANMQARATHLGATLQIESKPEHGTTIRLTFPANPIPPTPDEKEPAHQTVDC